MCRAPLAKAYAAVLNARSTSTTITGPVARCASAVATNRAPSAVAGSAELGIDPRSGVTSSALRLALDRCRRGTLDAQVPAPVVEQRHRVLGLAREHVHLADEQVVIAGRERLDHGAFQARDRTVEQREARDPVMPGRGTEVR